MMYDNSEVRFGRLTALDVPAALEIQSGAYPAFLREDDRAFLSRINLTASYCLAARRGEELLGYLLAHGWVRESPPPVGTVLPDGTHSEILFIHDLAAASSGRGLEIGRRLVARAFELAAQDGLRRAELIAVEGAAAYWRGLGFVEGPVSGELHAKLATYGPLARWMTREIPAPC
jgi:ribosomal protein S18 acetylase RimI-like enzyme